MIYSLISYKTKLKGVPFKNHLRHFYIFCLWRKKNLKKKFKKIKIGDYGLQIIKKKNFNKEFLKNPDRLLESSLPNSPITTITYYFFNGKI